MTSWLVTFTSAADDYSTDVDLLDTIGFSNKWTSHTSGAFSQPKGTFTNQTNRAVDEGGDWILRDIDINTTAPNRNGSGECRVGNAGNFPVGDLTWKVVRKL